MRSLRCLPQLSALHDVISAGRLVPTMALVLVASSLATGASTSAQLTVGSNTRFNQNDPAGGPGVGADNRFGAAVAVCDFDDDGYQDLAIGAPGSPFEFGVVIEAAGLVHVLYGGENGLSVGGSHTRSQPLTGWDPPEESDFFASALAGGDFNGDGFCDLAVGTSEEDLSEDDERQNAGTVHVFLGSAGGLGTASAVLSQWSTGGAETPEAFDRFGRSLAAADIDGDGLDDLLVYVSDSPGGGDPGGLIHVFVGREEGLAHSFILAQSDLTTSEHYEGGFGLTMVFGHFNEDPYLDLAVGAPGHIDRYGRVHVVPGNATGLDLAGAMVISQQTPGIGLVDEQADRFGKYLSAGDFDGDGLDELAVGYQEGIGFAPEVAQAGAVVVLDGLDAFLAQGSPLVAQLWHQDVTGVSDQAETGDHFEVVAAGDFDDDGFDDLAIGVPEEDFEGGGHTDNGALHVLYGSPVGLTAAREQFHGQGGWNVGSAEDDDFFGSVLVSGDFDDDGIDELVVGVPSEGVQGEANAGLVAVITGRRNPLLFADGFEGGDLTAWDEAVP